MSVIPVRNNTALSRFELDAEGGTAVANYRLDGGVMTFFHTEDARPPAGPRHRVRGALDEARVKGFKVKPRCSFVGQYMSRHPETHDLLA